MCRKSRSTYLRFLYAADHGGGVEFVCGDGGAQHVEPVQGGFGVDLVLPSFDGQGGIGDGNGEVLAGLVPADHLADLDPDGPGAGKPAGGHAGDDGGEQFLGGGEQVFAVAGAVGGQDRVAAGDQPLAGEVIGGDLGEILLIEETELQRAVVGHELFDGGGAQRGDPSVGVRLRRPVFPLVHGLDPGAGDHPPVPDHDHLLQPELLPDHVHDGGEGAGVAGVAGEHPDRDRPAGRVGEQPVLDLQLAFLAVPGVAAGSQRAVRAFHPGAGQVEQRHLRRVGLRAEVAAGQLRLDRVLAVLQPVHRRVDVIGGRPGHAQVRAQGGIGPPGQGGQFGAGLDHPGDDQRQGQVPLAARGAEQGGQAQRMAAWRARRRRARAAPTAVIITACPAGTSRSPFKVASIADTASAGSADRFASVSCRTLPPSR